MQVRKPSMSINKCSAIMLLQVESIEGMCTKMIITRAHKRVEVFAIGPQPLST